MGEIQLETLQEICRNGKIKWSLHALKRIRERKISSESVLNTILSGKIIKQYRDDRPLPSCLVFNFDSNTPLHTVVSTDNESIYVITAYNPTLDQWENDFKTRKEND
jgi:hypothetical protein